MNKKLVLVVTKGVVARTASRGKLKLVPQTQRPALNYSSGYYGANRGKSCEVGGVVMSLDDRISWDMR
jgi:hypothetical protein